MKAIQLPKLIRRNLRPISEREFYHAHEWKFVMLFVAFPVLDGILPKRYSREKLIWQYYQNHFFSFYVSRYLDHLAQLIDATHILCGSKISFERLREARTLLSSFVDNFEPLYGESNMVFNIHLLTHLADCVRFIGPLFAYSNYNFEDQIGHLVSLQ